MTAITIFFKSIIIEILLISLNASGTSYRGEWSQGKMNGEGTLILEENSDNPGQCFSGIFR